MRRFALLTLVLFLAGIAQAGDPPETFVKAGKLLDVRTGKLLSNQVIVIRGDRVERDAGVDIGRLRRP